MNEKATKQGGAVELLHFNGIDKATGDYLFPPVALEDLYRIIREREIALPPAERELREEADRWNTLYFDEEYLGVRDGIDPQSLSKSGWGLVLPAVIPGDAQGHKAQEALLESLKPLLDHRKSLAGKHFKVFSGDDSPQPKESARKWLARHGASNDLPVDPNRGVPYYLLLAGSPEEVPFEFQYELDVEYAVGRIHFDTPEEYARYARSVVEAERGPTLRQRRVALFGVDIPGDMATQISYSGLLQPLHAQLSSEPVGENLEMDSLWTVDAFLGADATKARLGQLLGGPQTPALLFAASHGLGFHNINDPQFEQRTGALLCQDWPGPGHAPTPEHVFAAEDISADARLLGTVAFFFACYGAGIPAHQDLPTDCRVQQRSPQRIARRPFVSRLPQRLLSHECGGALAVIGHVERAWACSFSTPHLGQGADLFVDGLRRLMRGETVGHAMELFNNRYSRKAVELSKLLADTKWDLPLRHSGGSGSKQQIMEGWIETYDARNYVVLGDPAVRLSLADK